MGLGSSVVERKTENLGVGSPILPPGILMKARQTASFCYKKSGCQKATAGDDFEVWLNILTVFYY